MGYPADKETWPRVATNDIITADSTNNWEVFLENLQDTLGFGANSPYPLMKMMCHSALAGFPSFPFYNVNGFSGGAIPKGAFASPVSGTVKNLYVQTEGTLAVGAIYFYEIYVNDIATGITVQVTSADGINPVSDLVHTAPITAGQRITCLCDNIGTIAGGFPGNAVFIVE